MSGSVFIDANVVVYLFDRDSPGKQEVARRLIETVAKDLVVSPQVLQEFYVTVTRKLAKPLSEADAEAATRDLAAFDVQPVDGAMVLAAISRARADRMSLWDALIVEAAVAAHCTRLLSEDLQDGRQFGSTRVENPFAAA